MTTVSPIARTTTAKVGASSPSIHKTNIKEAEKYLDSGYNGAELKVAKMFGRPKVKEIMEKNGFSFIGVRQDERKFIWVTMIEDKNTIKGLKTEWDFMMVNYFNPSNTESSIIENLNAKVKLETALSDKKIQELIKIYSVDVNKIGYLHYGTGLTEKLGSAVSIKLGGGSDHTEYSITINGALSVEKMIEKLEEEIPKFYRSKDKTEYRGLEQGSDVKIKTSDGARGPQATDVKLEE